jgi:hypothetical protein
VPLIFANSASLLLLRALVEIVQSEGIIKCALDRSVYKIVKHGFRIKINCPVSVGAEMSNVNIKLWNWSISNIVPIRFFSHLSFSKFVPLRTFLCSTFRIDKRLPVSLLSMNHDKFSRRLQHSVSGSFCDRPPRHRFLLVSLCLKANAFFTDFFYSFIYSTMASVLLFHEIKPVRRCNNVTHSVLNSALSKMPKMFNILLQQFARLAELTGC